MNIVLNASQPASVFYGMHMEPGTAEYINKEGEAYKVFLNEETVKRMNPTFIGKPVYVLHKNKVDLSKVEREAAGWVVESFYNKADGKTWCKFLVFSDEGHAKIRAGWKLSNAYQPKQMGPGGRWHGMEYKAEVLEGEYDHLAIVPNPRYESSVIMDAEEFKAYNLAKEADLFKLANATDKPKGEKKMGVLNIFKRERVDNSADLEGLMVTLPKSKKDVTLQNAVELADKLMNMHGYASDDHMVKVNDEEEMSVSQLRDCYGKMKSDMDDLKKKNSEAAEKVKELEAHGVKTNEEKEAAEKKANEEKEKKENEEKEKAESEKEKKENASHFETLRNAAQKADEEKAQEIVMNSDRVALGKKLF